MADEVYYAKVYRKDDRWIWLGGNGSRMKFIYSGDVVRSRCGRSGEHVSDQPAGIFSANVLLHIGFRDWCGEVVCSRAFNKRTPFSVTLALSKSGYEKLMMGFVTSVFSRHLTCNRMHVCLYFIRHFTNLVLMQYQMILYSSHHKAGWYYKLFRLSES